ncbi:hypothetical protein BU23DRAFT_601405 [Bimuria novae-zelandiae CBS 107.79]|uniref:Ubiquitin-like protease family profile domain-containing protein n=1 Tax=Bimuria novae-zelandiae CBS 107.79 TaxID=1447943 RepID=A0A6A5UYU7_9PLEO|nr:hypothetical protein BU23DRAFT_601405 [Bimuria novae-zelandiae CBS 107.79]
MFDSIKQSFNNTVNSLSGFVGGTSTAAVPATGNTNDAVEPSRARSPRTSRSPTSRRAPQTGHSTSSPSRRKQNSSYRLDGGLNPPNSGRPRAGLDERGRLPGKTKSGATPLPDPRFHFHDQHRNMKPGASHAPQPKNTLTQSTYQLPKSAQKTTYSHRSAPSYLDFPNVDEQFASSARPVKKRRTGNDTQYATGIWDEEDDVQVISPEKHISRPVSRQSAGSGRASLPAARDAQSEFDRANSITNPRRKKPRTGASKVTNGNAPTSPIQLDDDASDRMVNPRQVQMHQFQQGIPGQGSTSTARPSSETTSRYFPTKVNHSTRAEGVLRQTKVTKSEHLRDQFSRGPSSGASKKMGKSSWASWPLRWARTHKFAFQGEDISLSNEKSNTSTSDVYSIMTMDTRHPRLEFSFKEFNLAHSDHKSRIRLYGPAMANGFRNTLDLEFTTKNDLTVFEKAVMGAITQRQLVTKREEDMRKIFAKPLDGPSAPPAMLSDLGNVEQEHYATTGSKTPGLLNGLRGDKGDSKPQKSTQAVRVVKASAHNNPVRALTRPIRTTRATPSLTLDADDVEEEPSVVKYSVTHGFGAEWRKPLNYGTGRQRAVVNFEDLSRLDNGEFLNDQLIDFYLLYMFDHMEVPREKVHIFNTHFFTTLTRRVPGQKSAINYQGVARWAKEDIFGYDYIVVPINQDVHWYLAIICNVSNIARVPTIEDPRKSQEPDSEVSKAMRNESAAEADADPAAIVDSISPPALVDAPSPAPRSLAGQEAQETDDSDLNVVDGHATEPETSLNATGASDRVGESPAEETARSGKLSISDSKPEGVLSGNASIPSPKKQKRKPAFTARKCDLDEPVIIILDSLGGAAKSPAVRALKTYILAEGQEKRGMEAKIQQNAYYAKEGQIPQQENFSDCGVFLLGYAQKFFEDPDGFKTRLLSGKMRTEDDWGNMAAPKIREEIRGILQDLHEKQDAEYEQARKSRKSKATGTAVKNADVTIQQKEIVAQTEKPAAIKVIEEPTVDAKKNGSPGKEHPAALSEIPSGPRLASPFNPQPAQKRSRSRSLGATASVKPNRSPSSMAKPHVAPGANGQNVPPKANLHGRSKSPIVLVPSPVKKSPIRSSGQPVPREVVDQTSSKKPLPGSNNASKFNILQQDLQSGQGSYIVEIHSPAPKAENSIKRRLKPTMVASPSRGGSLPAVGSSQDPIAIDDSQEVLESTESPAKNRARHVSADPDLIITSPKGPKRAKLTPSRQHRQHMSSPGGRGRDRDSPSAQRKQSPFVADDLDARLQAPQLDYYERLKKKKETSKRRGSTPDGDTPGKSIEVPETPPRE